MSSRRSSLSLLAALLLLAPIGGHASTLTVQVDGTVVFLDDDDGLLPVTASVGDAWSIVYVISSIAPPNACLDSGCYYGVVKSITATIAGQSFTITPPGELGSYQVSENTSFFLDGDDRWTVMAASSEFAVLPPDLRYSMSVNLFAPGDSTLVVDSSYLPIADLQLATRSLMTFGVTRYFEDFSYETDDSVRGRVSSIQQWVSVPEPAPAWLMIGGLVGLAASTGRRRNTVPK